MKAGTYPGYVVDHSFQWRTNLITRRTLHQQCKEGRKERREEGEEVNEWEMDEDGIELIDF